MREYIWVVLNMNFSPDDDRYIYELVSKNIKYFRLHNNSKYSHYGRMTQEELAGLLGLSRVQLTRGLGELRSRGIISTSRCRIQVLNFPLLAALCTSETL